MTETLLPCPFCGKSVAEIDDAKELEWCPHYDDCDHAEYEQCEMHTVVCNVHKGGCGASSGYYDTVKNAVAAWNRRAERTARIVVSHGSHGPEPRFPGDVWTMHHVCSACGLPIDRDDAYCKHCGAKLEGV